MLFWSKIIKAIPFLLQVILVVVVVVIFAFWDPFGIFIPTKLKLKDTPVDVQSIRDIGQLITAEYYGEVIGSYAHEVEEEQDTTMEAYREKMTNLFEYYVDGINDLHDMLEDKDLKKNKIYDAYEASFSEIDEDENFNQLLNYIYITDKKDFKTKHLDDQLNKINKKNLIKKAVRNGYANDIRYNDATGFLNELFATYESTLEKEKKKILKKSNLVMLGRGWVKAGFDFGDFTERNFRYDKDRKSIYFIGFKPQILSATINPWFIPEKGVEGFEFLVVERRAKRDYKIVQQVKQRCLDELVRKAHEREILLKSVENARESLKEFFSLLLNDEVRQVVFYDNELDFTYSEIIKNDTITGEELLLIDHVLNKQDLQGIDANELVQAKNTFIDSLRHTKAKLVVLNMQDTTGWSPELTVTYAVCRDGIFDEMEDRTMMCNFSHRYMLLDQAQISLGYTCNGQLEKIEWIVDNTNIFIARDSSSIAKTKEIYNKDDIDLLYVADSTLVGVRVGKFNKRNEYNKLLDSLISKVCESCE